MQTKFGKEKKLFKTDSFRVKYGTIDATKLNAIYIDIESWVEPQELLNFDSNIRITRKNILLKLKETLDYDFFSENFIVDLDLRSSGMHLNKKSFMFIEITVFPKKYLKFNSEILIKKTVSFDQITEQIGIETAMLQLLNPEYKLEIIPYVKNRNYSLRIPTKQVGNFLKNEEALYTLVNSDMAKREKPLPQYFEMDKRIRYRVKNGDYLGKIAYKYGVRVSDIKRWNGLKNNNLRIGQRLSIYPKRLRVPKVSKTSVVSIISMGKPTIYIVKKGDSLWTIARKFEKVSVNQIKKWNNISTSTNISNTYIAYISICPCFSVTS